MNKINTKQDKIFSTGIVLSFFIIVFPILLYAGLSMRFGNWNFISDAEITDLKLCEPHQIKNHNAITLESNLINDNSILICGSISSSLRANLWFLIYRNSSSKPVTNIDYDKVPDGNFQLLIPIPKEHNEGQYRVVVMYQRNIIATTEFIIIK